MHYQESSKNLARADNKPAYLNLNLQHYKSFQRYATSFMLEKKKTEFSFIFGGQKNIKIPASGHLPPHLRDKNPCLFAFHAERDQTSSDMSIYHWSAYMKNRPTQVLLHRLLG